VPAIAAITIAMALVALVELLIPLRARGRVGMAHLVPNLTLTLITFATNAVLNTVLVGALVWLQSIGFGLLHFVALDPLWATVVVVLALDFAFYAVHVAMHEVPALWRFHRVHHSDALVDVTTTIRQHPGEGLIRYAAMAVFAFALGASPAAFAVYRVWSALQGLTEHANVRLPLWLDTTLALFISSPNMHKVHHSRDPRYTDTNFSNITSLWDRLFFTFTPASRGADIDYGLEGFDARPDQSTWGLLVSPWRRREGAARSDLVEGNP
jgi:sterol desaturase/sphingolipid hydroxylase (fatty acid hydroxylase superfamily)